LINDLNGWRKCLIMENSANNYCYYSGLPSPLAYETVSDEPTDLSLIEIDRIIEMAWEDHTPFDAIYQQFGLNESQVKTLMKSQLKFKSYKLWRMRVKRFNAKHAKKNKFNVLKFKSRMQSIITGNKLSKR
jgi:uncharacterized protein (TIGR03643 family)